MSCNSSVIVSRCRSAPFSRTEFRGSRIYQSIIEQIRKVEEDIINDITRRLQCLAPGRTGKLAGYGKPLMPCQYSQNKVFSGTKKFHHPHHGLLNGMKLC